MNVLETEQYYGELSDLVADKMKSHLPIYRLTGQGRFYFTRTSFLEDCIVYNSGTTLINNYKDEMGELAIHRWKVNLINSGKDPKVELALRQDYGTILHIVYGNILNGDLIDYENLKTYVTDLSEVSGFTKERLAEVLFLTGEELEKDIASFVTWVNDYNIKPIGIEMMLKSDKWKVATALDLVCYATVDETGYWGELYKSGKNKGQPKASKKKVEKLIVVDFKSGKKGFYAKNVLQLLLSKDIFEECFPALSIDGIFNFAPNDWKSSPSYKFYDQERETKQIDYLKKIRDNVFTRGMVEFEEVLCKKRQRMFTGVVGLGVQNENIVQYMNNVDLANYHYDVHHLARTKYVWDLFDNVAVSDLMDVEEDELREIAKEAKVLFTDKLSFINKLTKVYYGKKG